MASHPPRRSVDHSVLQGLQLMLGDTVEVNDRTLLEGIAELFVQMGRTPEALSCLQEAKNLHRKKFDYQGDARVLRKLGQLHLQRGDRAEAVRSWQQSIHASREIDDTRGEAAALDCLAGLLQSEQRYAEAIQAFEETLGIKDTAGDLVGQARTLRQLGAAYRALGRHQDALRCFRQAVKIWKTEPNPVNECDCLEEIVGCYLALGRFGDLVRATDEVFELNDALQRQGDRSKLYMAVGMAWRRMGAWSDSLTAYGKAFEAARQEGTLRQQVAALVAQARTLRDIGRAPEALKLLQHAESEAKAGDAREMVGDVLLELGATQLMADHLAEAQKPLVEASRLLKASGAQDRAAEALVLLAGVTQRRGAGDPEGALVAAHSLGQGCGDTHQLAIINTFRGNVLRVQGRTDEAMRWLKNGLELIDDPIGIGRTHEETLLGSLVRPFEGLVDLLSSRGEVQAGFQTAQRAHAHACIRAAERLSVPDRSANNSGAVSHCERTLSVIRGSNARLEDAYDAAERKTVREQLHQLRTELHKHQEAAETHHPEYALLRFVRTLSLEELHKILEPKTALLCWLVGETHTYLWILTAHDLVPSVLPVGREQLGKMASGLSTALAEKSEPEVVSSYARNLASALLTEAWEVIQGVDRLVIVPDGVLFNVPFGCLVTPQGQYLSQTWDVAVVPSLPLWKISHQRARHSSRARNTRRVLAGQSGEGGSGKITRPRGLLGGHGAAGVNVVPFPPPTAGENPSDALVEIRASHRVEDFEALTRRTGAVLHVSAPLELSDGAGFTSGFALQDGGLTLQDLVRLTLSSPMALLSGTRLKPGGAGSGDEWLTLLLPLAYAGLGSLVFTRWPVDDKACRTFADTLFAGLNSGVPRIEAVRTARRAVATHKAYSHPHYWSAFELFGDVT